MIAADSAAPAPDIHAHRILILDFGAQYTQLIARRVRELGVYCEIHPWDIDDATVRAFGARGVILSGGPESVTDAAPPAAPAAACSSSACRCSASAMACRPWRSSSAGGWPPARYARVRLRRGAARRRRVGCSMASPIASAQGRAVLDVWMSHGDRVEALPPGFMRSPVPHDAPYAAMADERRRFYGVQFHPEVTHTRQGGAILERFVREICGCEARWTAGQHHRRSDRARARAGRAPSACCWGSPAASIPRWSRRCCIVRSAAAHLRIRRSRPAAPGRGRSGDAHLRRIARRATCMRVDAAERVLSRRSPGQTDPEAKRKIIGRLFIEVFEEQARQLTRHALAGAGHDLSGRDRVGRRAHRQGARDQVASQRRRTCPRT